MAGGCLLMARLKGEASQRMGLLCREFQTIAAEGAGTNIDVFRGIEAASSGRGTGFPELGS
jgi:hypothetical protein